MQESSSRISPYDQPHTFQSSLSNTPSLRHISGSRYSAISINSFDLFFGFMHGMQLTLSNITLSAAIDVLKGSHAVHKRISNDAISYICYDLATQDADDRNTCETNASEQGTRPSWNPKKLLRFIVFAFAYSLSSSQRKNITELLTRKLSRNRAKLLKQDEYFSLLRMVDDLRSYSSPKVLDSQFVNVVEDVVNLLVDIVSGKRHSFPDTKTSILFLLLEARFLSRAASGAYETLLMDRVEKTSSIHAMERSFLSVLRRIMCIEKRILDALDYVRDYSIIDNIGKRTGIMELHETLDYMHVGLSNTSGESIAGIDSLSNQLRWICTSCKELLGKMHKNSNTMTISQSDNSYNNLSCASNAGISIQNHQLVICDIHRMIVHGSADVLTMLSPLSGHSDGPCPIMQHVFQAVVLCSSVVSYNAEKLVSALLSETSRRTLSNTELGSLWALESMLGVLRRGDGGSASECSLRHARAFRTLSANICISIVMGDAGRIFGESSKATHVNYRVLGLFVDLFCTAPLTFMNNSLTELKKIIKYCNDKLPHELENVLCILTDLKYFSYASNYAEKICDAGEHSVLPCYYNTDKKAAFGLIEALARLLAHSLSHNKKPGHVQRLANYSHSVDWVDVLKALLYEHIHLASVSLMLSHGMDVLQDKKLQFSDVEFASCDISKIITEDKTSTIANLHDNAAEIRDKIGKSMERIRSMLSLHTEKLLCGEDSTKLVDAIPALHSQVWDENKNLHCAELDRQLADYMLLRSYISASRALDIVDSCKWKHYEKPSLDLVLNSYFRCAEIKSPDAARNGGIPGVESEITDHNTHSYRENHASFITEEVPNSLDTVEVGIVHDTHSPPPSGRHVL